MREDSLTRLVQSFPISHIAYVPAFHNSQQRERAKGDATIRKTYKTALELLLNTSTEKFMALGVHNSRDEIAEAQRIAQMERLSGTSTGRYLLRHLVLIPAEDRR